MSGGSALASQSAHGARELQLGIGTRVAIRGLVSRPDLNGAVGRVLRMDDKSGRYGVRCDWTRNLVAVKPGNLEALPFESHGEGAILSLLDLPSDALAAILSHLSPRALSRASASCAQLAAVVKTSTDGTWPRLLAHPLLAPYHDTSSEPTPSAYREAIRLRRQWHNGSLGERMRFSLSFDRFVRSIAVDFDSQPLTIAVGLSSGAVACAWCPDPRSQLSGPVGTFDATTDCEIDNLVGEAHEEQVLAIAVHAAGDGPGVVVSGCGIPAYRTVRRPHGADGACECATVKVWEMPAARGAVQGTNPISRPGRLVHTLSGHADTVHRLVLLPTSPNMDAQGGAPRFAVSASADCTLRVWDVREGVAVRTMAKHTCGVTCLVVSGGGERLLSGAESDGQIIEWAWRTGEALRLLPTEGMFFGPLSCLSYHEETRTLVMGSDWGQVCLCELRETPPYLPLRMKGIQFHRSSSEEENFRICAVQHDADKVVSVSRDGQLHVTQMHSRIEFDDAFAKHEYRFRTPSRGVFVGCTSRTARTFMMGNGSVRQDAKKHLAVTRALKNKDNPFLYEPCATWPPGRELRSVSSLDGDDNDVLRAQRMWSRSVRYYVESVVYKAGVMVHDGRDNVVCVLFAGCGDSDVSGSDHGRSDDDD